MGSMMKGREKEKEKEKEKDVLGAKLGGKRD